MNNNKNLQETIRKLQNVVYAIVGVYCDATSGFISNSARIQSLQDCALNDVRDESLRTKKIQESDLAWVIYGEGDPNKSSAKSFHISTQKEFKKRNSTGGLNHRFIGNMCIVVIYQFWEDYFRGEIAETFGTHKSNVCSDLFGDLRLLRHSIIHHHSVATKDVENCRLLRWFKENDEIFVDQYRLLQILSHVRSLELCIRDDIHK